MHKLQRMEKLIGDRRVEDERSLIKTPDVQANNQEHDLPTSTHQIRSDQHGSPCFIYTLAFFSALGGFLFGYDTGVVSGAMLLLKREMNLSSLWQELLVSITVGAAAVFCSGWRVSQRTLRQENLHTARQLHLLCWRNHHERRTKQRGSSVWETYGWAWDR